MKGSSKNIEERMTALFEKLHFQLPRQSASLAVTPMDCRPGGVLIELVPSKSDAARICLTVVNGDSNIYLWVGQSTSLEMLVNNEHDVEEACHAVIQGKFEEEVFFVGQKIAKCVGRIELAGKTQTCRYYGGFFPFRKKVRKHIQYTPYY